MATPTTGPSGLTGESSALLPGTGVLEILRRNPHVLLLPGLLLAMGMLASFRFAEARHNSEIEEQREAIQATIEPIRAELSRQLFSAVHLTEGVASLIVIQGDLARSKFRALATELFRQSDIIRNLALAPNNVVTQVFPLEGNASVLGFRYADSAEQWPSVARMMEENTLVVAGPVRLVQGGVGVIARRPIFVADAAEENGTRYWGLSSTVIDFEKLIERAHLVSAPHSVSLALRGVDGRGADGDVFWGDARVFEGSPVVGVISLPHGTWQLGGVPAAGWSSFAFIGSTDFYIGSAAALALSALVLRLLFVSCVLKIDEQSLRTAYASVEAVVVKRTGELAAAKDAAESADRTKSAFLASMSHELRTPLNSIIGFTGVMLQGLAGDLTAEQRKQLGMVMGSGTHLLALINDVLDISKIEAGQLSVSANPVDVPQLIEKVLEIVRPLAEQKHLLLAKKLSDDVRTMIGDSRRIEQILLNLLGNAIKFTESGSVSIDAMVVSDFISRESTTPCNAVLIRVSDSGIGIRSEDLPLLFQPFQQLDSSLSRNHEGTGLGLQISNRLADLMGGRISVESEWQKGSVFSVTLPMR